MKNNNFLYISLFIVTIVVGTVLIKVTNSSNDLRSEDYSKENSMSVSADSNDDTTTNIWDDNGIFKDYYKLAKNYLSTLSLDEKIAQILLVKYPKDTNNARSALEKYNLAGYIFYENDFADKTKYEVINMMEELQESSKTPLLTAVDEEGGSVVRVSSNSDLVSSPYKSPSELYENGGLSAIKEDTINKNTTLSELGINVNLAPVIDVASSGSYIYDRTLKQNTAITSEYAKTVISASKETNTSDVLKHFPGYGNNTDTHTGSSTDNRTYDDIRDNDLPPFRAGIKALAEAILVSHNIVTNIDDINPASLSTGVHNLLRNELAFTGVIISDDLSMGAVSSISDNVVKAVKAGNDLVIVGEYETAFRAIKKAIEDGTLTEDDINNHVGRIIAWKYYKGLMYNIK